MDDRLYYYVSGVVGLTASGVFTHDHSCWMYFTAEEKKRIGLHRPYGATKTGMFVPISILNTRYHNDT